MKVGRRLVNNTILLFGGDQLGSLLQFALLVYVAGKFGEAPIGLYAEALALVGGFALLADLGVVEYTIREVARRADPTRALVTRALFIRGTGVVLSTALAVVIGPLLLTDRPPEFLYLLLLLGGYQLMVSLADVLLAELKGMQLMGRVASVGVAARAVTLIVGGALVLWGVPFAVIFSAFPVAGLCYFLMAAVYSLRTVGPPPLRVLRWSELRAMLRLLIPFGSAILFNEAVSRQDVIILGRIGGSAAAGVYWSALKIATLFLGVSGFFQHAIYPMLSEMHVTDPGRLDRVCRQVTRYLLMAAFPVSAGIFAISDRLMLLLFKGKFEGSAVCLQIMCWVVVVGLTHSVFSALLSAVGRQHQKAIALAVNLTLGITLNLTLVPFLGAYGASISRLAVEVAPLIMYGWLARLALPGLNPLPDAVRPAAASVLMIVAVRALGWAPLPLAIGAGALVYPAALLLLGGFTAADWTVVRSVLPASWPGSTAGAAPGAGEHRSARGIE